VSSTAQPGRFILGQAAGPSLGHMAPNSGSLAQVGHPLHGRAVRDVSGSPRTCQCCTTRPVSGCVGQDLGWVGQESGRTIWMGIGTRAPAYCTGGGQGRSSRFSPPGCLRGRSWPSPLVALTPFNRPGPEGVRPGRSSRSAGRAWPGPANEIRMKHPGGRGADRDRVRQGFWVHSAAVWENRATRTEELIKRP